MSGVRTVVKDYDGGSEVIGYQSEYVTRQSGINAGLTHTYRDDFRLKSVETALGYSNVLIDMEQVAYPGPGRIRGKISRRTSTGISGITGSRFVVFPVLPYRKGMRKSANSLRLTIRRAAATTESLWKLRMWKAPYGFYCGRTMRR